MSRILVIGGGFAGLSAVERLSSESHHHDVILVDRRDSSHFLPLLPDVVGKSLPADALAYSLQAASQRWKFRFVQATVQSIDLSTRTVTTSVGTESYDALLIACGTETDFRTCEAWRKSSFSLDSIQDAVCLRDAVLRDTHAQYVVCGGGYTGVEVASHLQHLLSRRKVGKKVTLVGRAATLCSTLPVKHRLYLATHLRRSGVELRTSTTILNREGDQMALSDGSRFSHAALIWAAGVCTPSCVRDLPLPMNWQGRLAVDPYLSVGTGVFTAGDSAGFPLKQGLLRMGIQFSLTQGWHAAGNILRHLDGRVLEPYRVLDPGWVVPLANHRGCGTILGLPLFGGIPVFLHYFMSVFRSVGCGNRLALLKHLAGGS